MIAKARWIIPIILTILLGFGAFLRFENLNRQSYWMDEGYTVNAVISQESNGFRGLSSILDSGETYFCPLYCFPTSIIVQTLGREPLSYRILSALFGALFIPVIFFFTRTVFKRTDAALLASFFATFSYWQIAWSRQARWYTELEVFFWLALTFFYLLLQSSVLKQKITYGTLTCLFTVLAFLTQSTSYLLPVIMLCWFVYIKRPTWKHIFLGGIATLSFVGFMEFGLHLQFLVPMVQRLEINNNLGYYLSFYLRNYFPILLVAVCGYIRLQKEEKDKFLLLILPFALYVFTISIFSNIVHYRYLFHLTPIFYILASVTILNLLDEVRYFRIKTVLFSLIIFLFFILKLGVLVPKNYYVLEADDPAVLRRPYYAYTPQPDFNNAYAKIKADKQDGDIVISSHPQFNKIFLNEPGYWLSYNYLMQEDYSKSASREKDFYVNADTIESLAELKDLMQKHHGYIVIDFMAIDGRLDPDMIRYIEENSSLIFFRISNSYSKIWVYHF